MKVKDITNLAKRVFGSRLLSRSFVAAAVAASAAYFVTGMLKIPKQGLGAATASAQTCTSGVNTYTYDSDGRVSQVQIGCSYVVTYNYDAVGNLLSISVAP